MGRPPNVPFGFVAFSDRSVGGFLAKVGEFATLSLSQGKPAICFGDRTLLVICLQNSLTARMS